MGAPKNQIGFNLCSRSFAFGVTVEDFTKITAREDEEELWADTLTAKLDALDGVSDVDFNGHFGPFIYFTINADDDTSGKRDEIFSMIYDYTHGKEI